MSEWERLEAWREADPERRSYAVKTFAPILDDPRCDAVRVSLDGQDGRLIFAYDLDAPPGKSECYSLATVFAGHRVGVEAVVAAALARWDELYPEPAVEVGRAARLTVAT